MIANLIIGAIIIGVIYNFLDNLGIMDFIWVLVALIGGGYLAAMGIGCMGSWFGWDYDSVKSISYTVILVLGGLIIISKIRENA